MIYDLFHSISDAQIDGKTVGATKVFAHFIDQVQLAEALQFDTIWCAESHFSSETQKSTSVATIPHFEGEVGLNSDSFQLAHLIFQRTKKIHFGTAIHNIVGGSGGPIASADRVNFLSFLNETRGGWNRNLRIGFASGRFPYQNTPFLMPRNHEEEVLWPLLKRYAFLEALEIFLRLVKGETLNSEMTKEWILAPEEIPDSSLREKYKTGFHMPKRWVFENISLVPRSSKYSLLEFFLGSHDPLALDWGLNWWDLNLFNLSFTSPQALETLHQEMKIKSEKAGRQWSRGRLPRTVLVFIDRERSKAYQLADRVLSSYTEAMRGTVQVPPKNVLLERALVGDPQEIRDQISPQGTRGFHPNDRLMLWFEFNQIDNELIKSQMKLFMEQVVSRL